MTRSAPQVARNPLKRLAALALQPAARMLARSLLVLSLLAGVARAQDKTGTNTGTTPTGTGMCTGDMTGTISLSIRKSGGGYDSIASTYVPYVFGGAECLCTNDDIAVRIQITNSKLTTSSGNAELWVGTNCQQINNRNNGTL